MASRAVNIAARLAAVMALVSTSDLAAQNKAKRVTPPSQRVQQANAAPQAQPAPAVNEALLQARLAAGEWGPAVDMALAQRDAATKTNILKNVVNAQRAAGEPAIADATARFIQQNEERSLMRGDLLRERVFAGGGSMANFQPLIDLMTQTIQPDQWDLQGGPGSISQFDTGVRVDPNGLLRQVSKEEKDGRLETLGRRAREADLNADMARQSTLRMVSLTRLEKAVAERVQAGQPVLETMQRLAGLSQIRYVFVYPEEKEIVIAGPAEGWRYDDNGRPVGRESAQPMMQLDDFVVVLRTFAPGGEGVFGCSINPREANMKDVKDFVAASNAAGPLRPGTLGRWIGELHKRLGMQDVVVYGVPANSRVAQVLVEADYRMKLIGVDKVDAGSKIPSYFDLLKATDQSSAAPMEALRWWMTMKYASILHSPDRSFFEIKGSSVLVQSENQFVNSQGQHVPTGVSEPTNRLFAANFTQHYNELAQRDAVFADLRNIFDLGMVAALCRQEHLYERCKFDLGVFAANGAYRVSELPAPKEVDTVVNHRVYNGRNIVVQVAGGVRADIVAAVRDPELAKEDAALSQVGVRGKLPELPAGRWWWDARE